MKRPAITKDFEWKGLTRAQIAERYDLTESEFNKYAYEFLQCEGYTARKECMTLHEYLIEMATPYYDLRTFGMDAVL